MKLEKFNPFAAARLNAGYSSQRKLASAIGISQPTYSQWERGKYASVYEHNLTQFKKMCDIFGWTYEEGLNNLSNLNKWRKDPNVHIVNPTMEQAQAIAKTWKPDLATLDTSNTDISKEMEMLDNPLKIWRGQKNLTRSEAAKLCHVDINVYSDCEDGIKKPNGFDLTKILKGTGLGFVDIQKIFRDDTVKNAIENALAAQSKQEISYIEKPEEPKPTYSYVEKPEAPKSTYSYGEKIGEIKLDENGCPYTEFDENEEVHDNMDEVITERDENGKPVAGRYSWQMTEEEAEALNEPHDFRDEVIDEVLEKMYGQMDYKKYVYLVGLLGR